MGREVLADGHQPNATPGPFLSRVERVLSRSSQLSTINYQLFERLWFNSRMSSCQVDGPGATPGSRTNSVQAARPHAAESPKLSSLRAARRQPANFHLGSWQTSNAPALQAG